MRETLNLYEFPSGSPKHYELERRPNNRERQGSQDIGGVSPLGEPGSNSASPSEHQFRVALAQSLEASGLGFTGINHSGHASMGQSKMIHENNHGLFDDQMFAKVMEKLPFHFGEAYDRNSQAYSYEYPTVSLMSPNTSYHYNGYPAGVIGLDQTVKNHPYLTFDGSNSYNTPASVNQKSKCENIYRNYPSSVNMSGGTTSTRSILKTPASRGCGQQQTPDLWLPDVSTLGGAKQKRKRKRGVSKASSKCDVKSELAAGSAASKKLKKNSVDPSLVDKEGKLMGKESKGSVGRSKVASSSYRGVSQCRDKRYQARIRVKGKLKYLGRFKDELEAAVCYDEAAIRTHGTKARLNFPSDLNLILWMPRSLSEQVVKKTVRDLLHAVSVSSVEDQFGLNSWF